MLYMIGIGLCNGKDISLRGLEILKKCDFVYLESYTSILCCEKEKLEEIYGKKIIYVNREMVEINAEKTILKNAKEKNVAFLVIGDIFSATTHMDLFLRAKKMGIDVEVIHNASIVNVVSETGLSLYKFGGIASIPFENENVESPYEVFKKNHSLGFHTLFLLDLDPENKKYLSANEGIKYLLRMSKKKEDNLFNTETHCLVCCKLGCPDKKIIYGKAGKLLEKKFSSFPQCIIVPGKLHFIEEEALEFFKL